MQLKYLNRRDFILAGGVHTHSLTHAHTRGYICVLRLRHLGRHHAPQIGGSVGRHRFEAGAESPPVPQGITVEIVGLNWWISSS